MVNSLMRNSKMCEEASYNLRYTETYAILTITTPNIDVEHEDSINLEVHDKELVFTAPPYHLRIPSDKHLQQTNVYPEKIEYDKASIIYHVPLQTDKNGDAESAQHCFKYGFGDFYSSVLNIQNNQDFKTLTNPEKSSNDERRAKRLNDEQTDFNPEHYGMDYVQYVIDGFGLESSIIPSEVQLTEDQKYRIRLITEDKTHKLEEYLNLRQNFSTLAGLVDILLAVLYDKLINHNELNEAISHFNIHRISATLSYFEKFDSIQEVLLAFYRRCCIYPLYRSKNLAQTCAALLQDALMQEDFNNWILEKLMYCYEAFKTHDTVVLNYYYIKDYVKLVQSCSVCDPLREIGKDIEMLSSSICDGYLGLEKMSIAFKMVKSIMEEEDESTDSDDTVSSGESDETESDYSGTTTSDDEVIHYQPEESVLEKLKNLKLQS
ncbi:protein SHQ1 homolog [Topomyia yanbarensis]|uniref:protein SHQ1 homolog n=1 Tax=Topomyia yanbarensis TaxID=2498891 RepID=UPI00273BFC77|nr:protein SHQ1 homolog [Topomyia yanbarensis]